MQKKQTEKFKEESVCREYAFISHLKQQKQLQ
jgi:hypothetical protein